VANPLLDAAGLQARLGAGLPTVVLDVRWALGDPHGREHYVQEHLPGAVYVDLATELAAPAGPGRGRHPLPAAADFEAAARSWGINGGDVVVAYDDSANQSAARVWWLLRNAGLAEVYLLDGGLAAWRAAGLPLAAGPVTPVPGNVALTEGNMPAIDTAAAASWPEGGLLLDARAAERYRGDLEPVDPRPGHIPGAISAPTTENVDGSSKLWGFGKTSRWRCIAVPASRPPTSWRPLRSQGSGPPCIRARFRSGRTTRICRWLPVRSRPAAPLEPRSGNLGARRGSVAL
jgi:thiosulfate/3-mercaptopyruvate sulfurtransferase